MAGTWTRIDVGDTGAAGWYFSHAAVERTGAARVWHTWNGKTYLYSPATNTWSQQTSATPLGWRENFGSIHDSDRGLFWIGPQTSFPGPFDGAVTYNPATFTYTATDTGGFGGNVCQAWSATLKRLYAFGGWTTRALRYRSTNPEGVWVDSGASGPFPSQVVQDGARLTSLRAGMDTRNGRLYYLVDNQVLLIYTPGTNAWTSVATTGPTPPSNTVFILMESENMIVGWCGFDDIVDPATHSVRQTYMLDLATNQWFLGPSGVDAPSAGVMVKNIPLYDWVNSRVLLLTSAAGSGTQVWQYVVSGGPGPIPTMVTLTIQVAGTGTGTVSGAGSYVSGTSVTPTATPASGSTFTGWSQSVPIVLTANTTITATFMLNPPNPPPVDPSDLDLPVQQFVPFPLPAITSNSAPFENGGQTKDVNSAYDTLRKKLIMGTGDFTSTFSGGSGNQSIFTYTPQTNTWATISPYCHPPGQITPNHPTDRGPMIYDKLRDRLWLWNNVPFPDQENQTCNGNSIYKSGLLYMDMSTGVWHTTPFGPNSGGSLGNGAYDSTADCMLRFEGSTACSGSPGALVVMNLETFAQQRFDLCLTPIPKFTTASGGWVAAEQPQRVFFAWDDVGRNAYIVCPQRRLNAAGTVVETQASLYKFSRVTNTFTALTKAPVRASLTGALFPYFTEIVWDSVNSRVLYPVFLDPCGKIEQVLAYNPATDAWEDLIVAFNNAHGNSIGFHHDANCMVVAGSVFCNDYTQGNLFLFRYAPGSGGTPGDTVPPTAVITSPSNGTTVSGVITVSVDATDNVGVTRVSLFVNGTRVLDDFNFPYALSLDTTTMTNGPYTLVAKAYDAALNEGVSSSRSITVNNPVIPPPVDTTPPVCSITSPANLATVAGTISVTATATDAVGVTKVEIYLDGTRLNLDDTTAPYAFSINTVQLSEGDHTLQVKAYDTAGNVGVSSIITVTVDNVPPADTTAPVTSITAPASGATVSGASVLVTANATDATAVVKVEFYVDAILAVTDQTSPYGFTLNSTALSNGQHTVFTKAYDGAGNIGQSSTITFTVQNNPVPPQVPPVVAITVPSDLATVSGTVAVTATATDADGIQRVVLYVDGAQQPNPDLTSAYNFSWDSTGFSDGTHILTARGYDTLGNEGISPAITVTVNNAPPPDTTVPVVVLTSPDAGATLTGTAIVTGTATDGVGVTRVSLFLDGVRIMDDYFFPYSFSLDTTIYANGPHMLELRAYDAAGNEGLSAGHAVTFSNIPPDTTPPNVNITAPTTGTTVSDTVTVSTATDATGVVRVTLEVDGVPVQTIASTPQLLTQTPAFDLDTTVLSGGNHTIAVRAFDASGNQGLSTITVFVSNNSNPVTVEGVMQSVTVQWSEDATPTAGAVNFTQYRVTLGDETALVPLGTLTYTFASVPVGVYAGRVELTTADESQSAGLSTFKVYVREDPANLPANAFASIGSG